MDGLVCSAAVFVSMLHLSLSWGDFVLHAPTTGGYIVICIPCFFLRPLCNPEDKCIFVTLSCLISCTGVSAIVLWSIHKGGDLERQCSATLGILPSISRQIQCLCYTWFWLTENLWVTLSSTWKGNTSGSATWFVSVKWPCCQYWCRQLFYYVKAMIDFFLQCSQGKKGNKEGSGNWSTATVQALIADWRHLTKLLAIDMMGTVVFTFNSSLEKKVFQGRHFFPTKYTFIIK